MSCDGETKVAAKVAKAVRLDQNVLKHTCRPAYLCSLLLIHIFIARELFSDLKPSRLQGFFVPVKSALTRFHQSFVTGKHLQTLQGWDGYEAIVVESPALLPDVSY